MDHSHKHNHISDRVQGFPLKHCTVVMISETADTYFSAVANPWIVYSNCPCKALHLVFCLLFSAFLLYLRRLT